MSSKKRKWQPTPVFLPGESHGQTSLAGYSPWGHKESDTTEQIMHTHTWESEKEAGWWKQRLKWCGHKSKNVGMPPGSKKTAFPLGPPESVQPCRHPGPSQNPYSSHRKLIQRSWVLLSEISHWGTLSWGVRGSVFCIKKIILLRRVDCSVSQEINHKALDII